MPRRQQQQQHWSRGGSMPRQQQQQQQWSRGGGIPHQRSSHYGQEDSPPPPGAPMCAGYRCGRCGKHGHKSEHCAAPRRFEGICGACGQYGHMWRNCALSNRQPHHLNVFTSSGECYVTNAHGADNIVIPQQQANAVDLGGEGTPFQQSSDTRHYSIGMSGGGGGDGDALGIGVPSGGGDNDDDDWNRGVARQQQLHMQHNGRVVETSGAPGGVPEVTGRTEVAPFLERFLAVITGLFTEVSSRCILFAPSPPTPPLRCCPQSPLFSRTAARVLQSFLGTPVLSSMASLPRIASTTDGSRVRGSGFSCLVTASVRR